MPSLQVDMLDDGLPRIRIRIRQMVDGSLVESSDLTAGVDTGASEKFIAPGILAAFGFKPTRRGRVQTGSSGHGVLVGSDVEMAVLDTGEEEQWLPMTVGEVEHMPFPGCHAVIGWAFLKRCVFVCDGPNQKFSLKW